MFARSFLSQHLSTHLGVEVPDTANISESEHPREFANELGDSVISTRERHLHGTLAGRYILQLRCSNI